MSQAPGPWEAKPTAGHNTHGQSAVYGPDGRDIAIVYDGKANARLIAAAPAMRTALEQIAGAPDAWFNPKLLGWVTKARAALALAKETK